MGGLADLIAALERAQAAMETRAAIECAREAGHAYLVQLRETTPVLTGELRASERVDAVRGSGTYATATIGAHTVYAEFRNNGGTITVKRARVLTNGSEFFGRSVTQAGSHYFERATGQAATPIDDACKKVIEGILRDAGL